MGKGRKDVEKNKTMKRQEITKGILPLKGGERQNVLKRHKTVRGLPNPEPVKPAVDTQTEKMPKAGQNMKEVSRRKHSKPHFSTRIIAVLAVTDDKEKSVDVANIALALADKGANVLVIDGNRSQTLTRMHYVEELDGMKYDAFLENKVGKVGTIVGGALNACNTRTKATSVPCLTVRSPTEKQGTLYLSPAATFQDDEDMCSNLFDPSNNAMLYEVVMKTVEEYEIDYVLIDLGVQRSHITELFVTWCAHYVIPWVAEDSLIFSNLELMGEDMLRWNKTKYEYKLSLKGTKEITLVPEHEGILFGIIGSCYASMPEDIYTWKTCQSLYSSLDETKFRTGRLVMPEDIYSESDANIYMTELVRARGGKPFVIADEEPATKRNEFAELCDTIVAIITVGIGWK